MALWGVMPSKRSTTSAGRARARRRRPVKRRAIARAPSARALSARAIEANLAELAHEIRTPLTGILALAELLTTSELGAREREWAGAIKSTAEHLAMLTSLIVDAARAGAKRLVLRRELVQPRRLAEALAASLKARAEAKGLAPEVAIASDLPAAVIGDALRSPIPGSAFRPPISGGCFVRSRKRVRPPRAASGAPASGSLWSSASPRPWGATSR